MSAKAQRLLYNMEEKSILRKEIAARKKQFSSEQLNSWSEQIMEKLSTTDLFQQARCIAIYHALPQEVQTAVFIEKWYQQKKLALPLVQGDDLLFLPYTGKDSIQKGSFGILEPIVTKDSESVESEIDLIVVPGGHLTANITGWDEAGGFTTAFCQLFTYRQSESVSTSNCWQKYRPSHSTRKWI